MPRSWSNTILAAQKVKKACSGCAAFRSGLTPPKLWGWMQAQGIWVSNGCGMECRHNNRASAPVGGHVHALGANSAMQSLSLARRLLLGVPPLPLPPPLLLPAKPGRLAGARRVNQRR